MSRAESEREEALPRRGGHGGREKETVARTAESPSALVRPRARVRAHSRSQRRRRSPNDTCRKFPWDPRVRCVRDAVVVYINASCRRLFSLHTSAFFSRLPFLHTPKHVFNIFYSSIVPPLVAIYYNGTAIVSAGFIIAGVTGRSLRAHWFMGHQCRRPSVPSLNTDLVADLSEPADTRPQFSRRSRPENVRYGTSPSNWIVPIVHGNRLR